MKSRFALSLVSALVVLLPSYTPAADTGAVWSSASTADLAGVGLVVSKEGGTALLISDNDLSGPNFSFAPLGAAEECLLYSFNSNLTVAFSAPVANLRLYLGFWRVATFTLNHTFEIKSGTGFTRDGNQITVASGFGSGIVEFTEPVSTLTILSSAFGTLDDSAQVLQFGVASSAPPTLAPPTVTIAGKRRILTTRKSITIRGTASGQAAISRVEFQAPGKPFNRAKGTSKWSFRFSPKRKVSKLKVRAVDIASKVSAPASLTVVRTAKPPQR